MLLAMADMLCERARADQIFSYSALSQYIYVKRHTDFVCHACLGSSSFPRSWQEIGMIATVYIIHVISWLCGVRICSMGAQLLTCPAESYCIGNRHL